MTEHLLPEVLDLVITCELTSQTKPSYWTLTTWGRLDNILAVKPKTISRVLSYILGSDSGSCLRGRIGDARIGYHASCQCHTTLPLW